LGDHLAYIFRRTDGNVDIFLLKDTGSIINQNYWAFGLCSLSSVPKKIEITVFQKS
jgi:hypothetical protein